MNKTLSGRIASHTLGRFGGKDIRYGFIGLELPSGEHVRAKVDKYTESETFQIGEQVEVDVETLGDTDIWVARKIRKLH
ncbi:hypothetical protein EU538_08645 [Candidatus Thorarchaeota archaeon]|jgi:hypothetical protein|nr:MAG: hypothetical protein EU538_08645 [Candidatus Thorarchaeota archaeon]